MREPGGLFWPCNSAHHAGLYFSLSFHPGAPFARYFLPLFIRARGSAKGGCCEGASINFEPGQRARVARREKEGRRRRAGGKQRRPVGGARLCLAQLLQRRRAAQRRDALLRAREGIRLFDRRVLQERRSEIKLEIPAGTQSSRPLRQSSASAVARERKTKARGTCQSMAPRWGPRHPSVRRRRPWFGPKEPNVACDNAAQRRSFSEGRT
ncbi:hypothetical protein HPB48_014122 [Haemaphysalis longicornis]|uniref:Uncharacterized protein n=1 Tax=Haemaphysalis longicornis TaxID=44386 RepID=A0A9J6FKV7_HAELO|nr:hypothetical protein HPB48_014122 [Haemaphysalis longicornis]